MGQGLSCAPSHYPPNAAHGLLSAIQHGDMNLVKSFLATDPSSVLRVSGNGGDRLSPLHLAASSGQIEILCLLLDHGVDPDLLNRHKQTPLMLAAMNGRIACVNKLIESGANILMFDSIRVRTCVHYAAFYGHPECLQVILSSAHSSSVAASWGFARFVNIRDGSGSTPLHLAARHRHAECVHILLDNGALVCASTGGFGYPGSTPLHLAARGGSVECARELLSWGADRIQRDSIGRNPYMVALRYKHVACAALLNPSSAEPLVWPSASILIATLNPEAKALLEKALIEANKKREKSILSEASYSLSLPVDSSLSVEDSELEDSEVDQCCICFEQACTMQVQDCGHQMCAHCTLALCCQNNKASSNQTTASTTKSPLCPFCRCTITQLVVARINRLANDNNNNNNADSDDHNDYDEDEGEVEMSPSKPRRSRKYWSYSEGSSSFKGLSAMGALGKMVGRGSGKIAAEGSGEMDKS